MQKVSFTLWGAPVTWKRAQRNFKTGAIYNPKKMENYQNRIVDKFMECCPDWRPVDRPVILQVIAYFDTPKSFPKWKKFLAESERLPYVSIPDADNLVKNVADALQKVAFVNDSRITDILVRKRYSAKPRAEVTIWFLDEPEKPNIIDETPGQLNLFT